MLIVISSDMIAVMMMNFITRLLRRMTITIIIDR